ncbi:MAG: GTPase RsgA, partial [Gemmatimonadota bacterium]
DRRVGEVGESTRKGRHTTVGVELIALSCGGYVADTPGLREVGLWGVPLEELDACFPEFEPYLGACRFGYSCTHVHEPGCAVLGAVESGHVPTERWESYRAIRESEEEAR